MGTLSLLELVLILTTVWISYKGLNDHEFFAKYAFDIDKLLIHKEYIRLISSGFLHVSWIHLFLNMMSFYFFSHALFVELGIVTYLLLYFGSMLAGNLFSLYVHRNHGDYTAVGASGAVCGLIFAFTGLFPHGELSMFLLPIGMPAWLFGLGYVLYTMYAIKKQHDNVAHEAHLGGGIFGMLLILIYQPSVFSTNTFPISIILIPSLIFILVILFVPHFLLVNYSWTKKNSYNTMDEEFNLRQVKKEKELDALLDKINKSGLDSLSKKERQRLEELSK